jgi:hypothetical protein
LIKAAGQFSRPDRDELARRKRWCKANKRKMEARSNCSRNRIRFARESGIYGTKLLAAELEKKKALGA